MTAGESCNREVVIIHREGTIVEAAKLMREYHVGDLVVVEEGDKGRIPVGIVTDRDLVVEIVAQGVDFDAVTIGDVMSFDLVTAEETESVRDTVKKMRSRGVRRMPVVDQSGVLQGILTVDDLIELYAEALCDLNAVTVQEQKRERECRV
ncbi:MAG: CBS domain-containing protein [bacterium]|nr:CBS domain-containing protein [bacterium]